MHCHLAGMQNEVIILDKQHRVRNGRPAEAAKESEQLKCSSEFHY